jgi:hypothetical protein
MKRAAVLLMAVVMGVAVSASAQQRPAPLPVPIPSNTGTASGHHGRLPVLRYPVSAAQYDQYSQFYIGLLRKAVGRQGITQGDVDKAILAIKDCAGRIEADGVVTRSESQYCRRVLREKIHELATPYLMKYAAEQ